MQRTVIMIFGILASSCGYANLSAASENEITPNLTIESVDKATEGYAYAPTRDVTQFVRAALRGTEAGDTEDVKGVDPQNLAVASTEHDTSTDAPYEEASTEEPGLISRAPSDRAPETTATPVPTERPTIGSSEHASASHTVRHARKTERHRKRNSDLRVASNTDRKKHVLTLPLPTVIGAFR